MVQQKLSAEQKHNAMAAAAAQQYLINNPPTYTTSHAAHYNVTLPGTAPSCVAYSETVARLAVKFNTGGIGISTIPKAVVTINYRRKSNREYPC
jgi:hypothetical protein